MALVLRREWWGRAGFGDGAAPSPFASFAGFGAWTAITPGNRALVVNSGFWDATWYLAHYPDVAAAKVDPVNHFLANGGTVAEHRDPGPNFHTGAYYAAYPDVAASGINALVHYAYFHDRPLPWVAAEKAAADALAAQQAAAATAKQQADANALAASKAATDKAIADAAAQRRLATQAQADAAAAARAQADAQAAAQTAQIAAAQNANDLQAALALQAANEAKAAADRLVAQTALDAARADAAAFAAESHASNVTVVTGGAPVAVTAPAEPPVSKVLLYGGLAVLALLLLKK